MFEKIFFDILILDSGDVGDTKRDIFKVLPEYKGTATTEFSKKRRIAHAQDDNNTPSNPEPVKTNKKAKIEEEKKSHKSSSTSKDNPTKGATEKKGNAHLFADIEVTNPVMSSIVFEERTKSRQIIKVSKIEAAMKGNFPITYNFITPTHYLHVFFLSLGSSLTPFPLYDDLYDLLREHSLRSKNHEETAQEQLTVCAASFPLF